MARPWIEFLFPQHLPWQDGLYGNARPDVRAKILSIDPDHGDSSCIVRYPPGWRRDTPEALACEEELYVLAGEIEINGQTYGEDSYACFPAGHVRQHAVSAEGCDALTFYSATPDVGDERDYDARDLVEHVDAIAMTWDTLSNDPNLDFMGLRRKVLRWDHEYDQQGTYLLATAPHNHPVGWKCPQITHPCVEECFMLAGDLTGLHGVMSTGAYFWRPEEIAHGPFGSHDGSLSLLRFKYGRHRNDWLTEDVPYRFHTPYKPELPPELGAYGKTPYRGAERY